MIGADDDGIRRQGEKMVMFSVMVIFGTTQDFALFNIPPYVNKDKQHFMDKIVKCVYAKPRSQSFIMFK